METYKTDDQTDQNDQSDDISAGSIGDENLVRVPRRHPFVFRCLKRKAYEDRDCFTENRVKLHFFPPLPGKKVVISVGKQVNQIPGECSSFPVSLLVIMKCLNGELSFFILYKYM